MYGKILVASLFLSLFTSVEALAQEYDIFVDKNNTSGTEDGTEANPFDTIGEALTLAVTYEPENRKIFVKNGEYSESLEIPEEAELYGESKNDTIVNGDGFGAVITMNNRTKLKNIKIYKGKYGISIEKNSKVEINRVKIQKSEKIGINIEESSKKRLVEIKDCEIYDSEGKGIYIKKNNYARIYDNEIYDNEEEGIDIRSKAKGSIKSNEIYKNGESGIELIVERSKMDIDKNKIYKNSASGIALQAYTGGLSAVSDNGIEKNKISANKHYGIKCDTPSNLKTNQPVLWSESVTLKNNSIEKNKQNLFSNICHFEKY
ncbi:MAG: right-handed parallel beta-helix repeat-containing protein [Candidatus Moraniibacteriota bacterium]